MMENRKDGGQHDPNIERFIPEDHLRDLVKNFEKGYPSAFQEILATNMDQLQHLIERIATQEANSHGLTKEVINALFAGVQAKIADRKFVRWVARTGAKAALENLRSTIHPDRGGGTL